METDITESNITESDITMETDITEFDTDVPAYSDTLGERQKCHCKRGVTLTTYAISSSSAAASTWQGMEGAEEEETQFLWLLGTLYG